MKNEWDLCKPFLSSIVSGDFKSFSKHTTHKDFKQCLPVMNHLLSKKQKSVSKTLETNNKHVSYFLTAIVFVCPIFNFINPKLFQSTAFASTVLLGLSVYETSSDVKLNNELNKMKWLLDHEKKFNSSVDPIPVPEKTREQNQ